MFDRRLFLKHSLLVAAGCLTPLPYVFSASGKNLYDVRIWSAPDHTRLVLDVSKSIRYEIFQLSKPNRIVIDLANTQLLQKARSKLNHQSKRITKIRHGKQGQTQRIVLDNPMKFEVKSFALPPNQHYKHHRLVIDLKDTNTKQIIAAKEKTVIVIDPGHGGEDPGAIGSRGSYEKNIVLAISKRLAKNINQDKRFAVVLTRNKDYYVALKQRIRIAQQNKAALFISIHADAALRKSAQGASVYTLSKKGSRTAFTKHLEKTQNASDVFGAEPKQITADKNLHNILLDLSRKNRRQESIRFASRLLKNIAPITKLHKKTPQQANFVVLKTPAIPSLLLETGFISNRTDEIYLSNKKHQQKIANAIYQSIKKYYG